MPFTRQFIKNAAKECDVDLPKELVDTLINEHLSVRDTYAESRVKEALEEQKPADPTPVKESDEYKALKKEFEDYKTQVNSEKAAAKIKDAYRAMLKECGISDKRIDAVMRVSDTSKVELDGEGKIKGVDELMESVKKEWSDFIVKDDKRGASTETPPGGTDDPGSGGKSRAAQVAAEHYARLYGTPKDGGEK